MQRTAVAICAGIIASMFFGCNKSNAVEEEHGIFEIIGHACRHMSDGPDITVTAAQTGPGPHLQFDHTRINVVLVDIEGGKGGSVHFGPDYTGDYLIMSDHPLALLSVTNGGEALEIERTILEQEIADSTGCPGIRKAILVDVKSGANIITIGPVNADTVRLVIEEAGHHHD